MCQADYKMVEAICAILAYLVQMPLIPVYAIVLTLLQPVEGFLVGFFRVAYSVIVESNANHVRTHKPAATSGYSCAHALTCPALAPSLSLVCAQLRGNPLACLLNMIGFSGLVPATAKLAKDIARRA